ncbi:uncharacterized protein K02A2.6-like, partial [Paramuricea clavata]
MEPMTKAIRAAITEHKNWKKELYSFLLNYRATPHSTTKFSPAELLFNRKIKMKLPNPVHQMQDTVKDKQVRENDVKAKERMKANADRVKKMRKSQKCLLIQPQPVKEEWQDSDNMGGDLSDDVADEINQDGEKKYKGGDIHRETGNQPKDT